MKEMISRIKQQYIFFAGYSLLLAAGFFLLFSKGKAGSFLLLNACHYQWLDLFFICYTNLGDGLFAVVLSLFYFFILKDRKQGLTMLIAYSFTGIVAQLIKPIIHSPRPQAYFYPERPSFFIDSIIHAGNASFPSGHTATAFALATILVFYAAKKWQQLFFLVLAALVGFSRIYLSQHFLTDVLAGSLIGVAGALLCIWWCRNLTDDQLAFKRKRN